MSTTESLCGFSIEFKGEKPKFISLVKKLFGEIDEDEGIGYWNVAKNQWSPCEANGKFGFVKMVENETDVLCLDFCSTDAEMQKNKQELVNLIGSEIEPSELGDVAFFAYIWYNGVDCPFEFYKG